MDDAFDDVAALFLRAGLDRATARVVAALALGGAALTPDLEARAGLRQAEVSLGTQRARARGWVALETERRPNKGRPMHRYALKVPPARVVDDLAADSPDEGAIAQLRNRFPAD